MISTECERRVVSRQDESNVDRYLRFSRKLRECLYRFMVIETYLLGKFNVSFGRQHCVTLEIVTFQVKVIGPSPFFLIGFMRRCVVCSQILEQTMADAHPCRQRP